MSTCLLLTTDSMAQVPAEEVAGKLTGEETLFLDLSESGVQTTLPGSWNRLQSLDLFQPDAFRDDLLNFLEEWPKKTILDGKSFDDLFRRIDGHSLWWTSVGCSRVSSRSPVRELKKLWILDRALRKTKVDRIILHCKSHDLEIAIRRRCSDEGIAVEPLEPKQKQDQQPDSLGAIWLVSQLGRLVAIPPKTLVYACLVRLFSRCPAESQSDGQKPAVLFKPKLSRNVDLTDDGVALPYWESFLEELRVQFPDVRQKFMLYVQSGKQSRLRIIAWLRTTGARLMRELDGAVPPPDRYTGLATWCRALPSQIAALFRFRRLLRLEPFKSTFTFAKTDVSSVMLPHLRRTIENMAEWERQVAKLVVSCAKIRNLKMVFVLGEFYPGPMRFVAAAKRLGIPVVAAQHGTIFPSHYVYTVPKGHVEGAPIPDYFAAYGQYSKEVLCDLGAYPEDRVWIIGSPRMDHLVKNPPGGTAARQRLELPADKKIVLIATHTPSTYPWFGETVKAVFDSTANRDDCLVCVKTHPGDKGGKERYSLAAREAGNTAVRFYDDRFDDLLAACDLLISGSSTTVLEATLLGKPTICANFSEEPDRYPYVADGASLPARSPQELGQSLDKLLSDGSDSEIDTRRQAFLTRHLGPTANGRGVDALIECVKPVLAP